MLFKTLLMDCKHVPTKRGNTDRPRNISLHFTIYSDWLSMTPDVDHVDAATFTLGISNILAIRGVEFWEKKV